jgi:[histone H3]-lysine27 N-trimethyltransferase EZH2
VLACPQRREVFQEVHDDGHNGCPIYPTESRTISQTVDTNIPSDSEDLNREEDNINSTTTYGRNGGSKLVSSVNTERGNSVSGDTSETENVPSDLPLSSLGKHKISNYGPSYRDHSPGKRQKAVTADIPSASSILYKHSTLETGYTRLDSKESRCDQLPSLDDSNKKISNKDGGSPTNTTENMGRNSNKVSSPKNLLEHTLSCWSALERDLYLKGIEIFGKNR